jgi:hypothetical protein
MKKYNLSVVMNDHVSTMGDCPFLAFRQGVVEGRPQGWLQIKKKGKLQAVAFLRSAVDLPADGPGGSWHSQGVDRGVGRDREGSLGLPSPFPYSYRPPTSPGVQRDSPLPAQGKTAVAEEHRTHALQRQGGRQPQGQEERASATVWQTMLRNNITTY